MIQGDGMTPGVVALFGAPGTCKSSIGMTWPGIVHVDDFDQGAHRAWGFKKMVVEGRVQHHVLTLPTKSLTVRYEKLSGYVQAWKEFTLDFARLCDDSKVRTIMWDTSTMLWALCIDSRLEEVQATKPDRKQLQQIEYAEPNSRMKVLFGAARAAGKWLIVTHHETAERKPLMFNGQPVMDDQGQQRMVETGNRVPDGFRYTLGLSDWVLHTRLRTEPKLDGAGKPIVVRGTPAMVQVPSVTIEKSAAGIDLIGTELDYMTYDKLVGLLRMMERL